MIISFEGFKEKEQELENYREKIFKLIDDFIATDDKFIKDNFKQGSPFLEYKNCSDFYIDNQRGGNFVIHYRYGITGARNFDHTFTTDEHKRLLDFMKDPELYKNSKKYNL